MLTQCKLLEVILAAVALALSGQRASAQDKPTPVPRSAPTRITATMEGDSVVKIVSPGYFETDVTKREGFVGSFYDLKSDPAKKFDLGPVLSENGILWTKNGHPNDLTKSDGSWYAAPCEKLEILEGEGARVRVRTSGPHCLYGKTDAKAQWKELGFEQTFTIYPNGACYIDYCLVAEKPLKLHHFLLIIKSNGSWGKRGTGAGAGEVRCASDSGDTKPAQSCLALQWSDGPTHFQDFLMVIQKGKFGGTYWNEGYLDKDVRTGLNLLSRWPGGTLPAGRDHIVLQFRFGHDINSSAAALRYAEDYRNPDAPGVTKGELVKDDGGDYDADGFNESEGCYVLKAAAGGVELTLHGTKTPRIEPVFKVKGWAGGPPKTIALGSDTLDAGKGFSASVAEGVLILQVLSEIKNDARLVIPAK